VSCETSSSWHPSLTTSHTLVVVSLLLRPADDETITELAGPNQLLGAFGRRNQWILLVAHGAYFNEYSHSHVAVVVFFDASVIGLASNRSSLYI
jgi:hypothetical protein